MEERSADEPTTPFEIGEPGALEVRLQGDDDRKLPIS